MGKSSVQSLDRSFELLELLCKNRGGMSIHLLSECTGLHKSTVHRLLNAMLEWGYVRRDPDSAVYHPGFKICELGEYVQNNLDVVDMAKRPMERLSRLTGETIHLVTRDGDEIVYIYKVESVHVAIRMVSRIGTRRPLYCTGVGKAILATCPEEAEQYWERTEVTAYTPHTLVHKNAFLRELSQIRERGYAMDNEENELGVRCIAAAIPDWKENAACALSISAPVSRMTDERVNSLIPQLLAVRRELAEALGRSFE